MSIFSAFVSQFQLLFQAQELSKTRESLVGAETSKKHLEERVGELTKQLQGNEEKLAVYERRSSGITGVTQPVDEDMNPEQQLRSEVAELR
jgi:nucleoprotein TPR